MKREKISQAISGIRPEYVAECQSYMPRSLPSEKEQKMGKHTRKIIALALAACLLLALGITACASDAIQSLIGKWWNGLILEKPTDELRQERPDYAEWLDEQLATQAAMAEIGEMATQVNETVDAPGLDGVSITLLESYYDGEKVSMACKLTLPQTPVDFGVDKADLDFEQMHETGNWNFAVSLEEDREKIQQKIERNETFGFIGHDVYVRDHVYANGEDIGCCHTDPDREGIFLVNPYVEGYGWIQLPQSALNQPSVQVELHVRSYPVYFWVEDGKVMQLLGEGVTVPVTFTLQNINES